MTGNDFNRQESYTKAQKALALRHFIESPGLRWSLMAILVVTFIFVIVSFLNAVPSNLEAENGTVSSSASTINDTSASSTKAVKFGAATTSGAQACPPVPAYPDENCTGVLPGIARTDASTTTITQDGAVIENLEFSGRLTIDADNVTIRNIRLTTGDYWGLLVYGSNATVEDSTFIGGENTQAPLAALNSGSFHVTRVDVSGGPDGVTMGSNSSLTDSYIHDLGAFEGAHNDGVNSDGRTNTSIIHNTVLNAIGQTSALTIGTSDAPSSLIVRDNWLAGGGYTVYGGLGGGVGNGIIFENNIFSRQYYPNSGAYGPVAYWQASNGNTWTNNKFDNGTVINP